MKKNNDTRKDFRAFEVWQEAIPNKLKTEKLNKQFNLNWGSRTWGQRAARGRTALKSQVEVDKLMAAREMSVMTKLKKASYLRKEALKMSRDVALTELAKDAFYQAYKKPMPKFKRIPLKEAESSVLKIVIADLQFKGGAEEISWANYIFDMAELKIKEYLRTKGNINEIRFVFLGDDIEGAHGHDSQLLEIVESSVNQAVQVQNIYSNRINEITANVRKMGYENLVNVLFVPYSNHGMIGGKGKNRKQFIREDLGLVILDHLSATLSKDIGIFEVDHDRMVVETKDGIYLHGHQDYMKNNDRTNALLGVDKDRHSAHWHHYYQEDVHGRTDTKYGTCRRTLQDYERMAGFRPIPQFTMSYTNAVTEVIEKVRL